MENSITIGTKPVLFHLLVSRLREMKGSVKFDRIEKELSTEDTVWV